MADIEKLFAYRTSPGSGDKIGTLRYVDSITGDTILGEQLALYGHPAKYVMIADGQSSGTTDLPAKGSAVIQGSSTTTQVNFDVGFGGGLSADVDAGVGMLIWIESGTNAHLIRKMISSAGSHQYTLNAALTADLTGSETYRPLIDCFRFNAMLIKSEFSVSGASCVIQPHFFSAPQDNVQPTPGVAKPHRYPEREYTLVGTDVNTDISDTSTYHGEVLSIGVHGAIGACLRVKSITSGSVSLWVALV